MPGQDKATRLLEAITQNTPDLIYVFDLNYHFSYANEALLKMWGLTLDEFIGKGLLEIGYEPWHAELHEREIDQVIATKNTIRGEVSFQHATLGKRIYDYIFVPIIDNNGKVEAIAGTSRDITQQVAARQQIEDSEMRFRNMVVQAPVAICVLRGKNYIVEVANDKQLQLWGKTEEEVINIPLFTAFPEGAGQGFEELLDAVFTTGESFISTDFPVTITRKGIKEAFYVNFVCKALLGSEHKIDGVISIATEITEKVVAVKKIEENEQRFRLALAGSNLIVFSQDKNLKHTWIYNSHPGFKAEDIIGKTDKDLHEPASAEILIAIKQKILDTGNPFTGDVEIELKGEQETYTMHIEAIKDVDEIITGIIGTAMNITELIKTQQKIKESEELFSNFGNNIQNLAWMATGDGDIFWYNQRWLDYTGLTLEEMKGWGWQKVHHPDHIESILETSKKLWVTNEPFELTFPLRRFDGEYRWFLTRGVPVTDENGKIYRWIGTNTDITLQREATKKIEESEERFRSLAQTLPQLVWVTDEKGNSEFKSYKWKDYSGIEPASEGAWKAMVHPDDYDRINGAWAHSLTTGNIYTCDVRLKSKEGVYRWYAVIGEPVLDKENKIVKWVGAFTDIQDQKIREEKKDEFISIASHEMKTPLTTAKAYLQMLELSLDENNEESTLYAKKASQSVSRLNELICELLDVGKIRLGKLNYTITTFNFNHLIESTVENIQLTSPLHTIIKTGKVHDEVTGDKDRLQQVVINLLNNAIKYSPGAKKVFITLSQENDMIKVSVKDTGIGIAKESLKKIFDKYHRIEEHAVHYQGLGIGLFISYEIIQRHHGNLWAESEPGKGSTFYFTIPANSAITHLK